MPAIYRTNAESFRLKSPFAGWVPSPLAYSHSACGFAAAWRSDPKYTSGGWPKTLIVHLSTFCYNAAQRCMPCGAVDKPPEPVRASRGKPPASAIRHGGLREAAECARARAFRPVPASASVHPDRGPEVKEVRASYSRFRWLCRSIHARRGASPLFCSASPLQRAGISPIELKQSSRKLNPLLHPTKHSESHSFRAKPISSRQSKMA